MLCAAAGLMATAMIISSFHRRPRPWTTDEVPVAFWSWREQTPAETDVRAAVETTRARTIFLHAGQIDFQDGRLSRIRPLAGKFPRNIELQLVYNATHALLAQLENVDERLLAESIAQSFSQDAERAAADEACLVGIQVDIDVPTRLLRRYALTLKALRAHLKPRVQLSITGLPTWMQSNELPATLAQVDFWVPQFYGGEIPGSFDEAIPISSPSDLERFVSRARSLNKPFYAGVAAYSYALLYSPSGALINLRGDLDPSLIAADADLELTEQRSFPNAAGEWRYAYRARADGVVDGLPIHAGELLVVDTPSAESLRTSTRIVRELAGEKLLGICIFRLPAADDPATLQIDQVATALSDRPSKLSIDFNFTAEPVRPRAASFAIENRGTANAVDLRIDLPVEPATIDSVSAPRNASIETLCRLNTNGTWSEQPCSQHRANLIRIVAPGLRSQRSFTVVLVFKSSAPNYVQPLSFETQTDDGQTYRQQREVYLQVK